MNSDSRNIINKILINVDTVIKNDKELWKTSPITINEFIKYRFDLIKLLIFVTIKNNLQEHQSTIYKNFSDMKKYMVCYNNILLEVKKYTYNLNLSEIKLDYMKGILDINFKILSLPFTIGHDILKYKRFDEKLAHGIQKDYFNKLAYYPVKGLLCFISFHKTKIKSETNILVFSETIGSKSKQEVKDIYPLISNKCSNLVLELNNIINVDLVNNFQNLNHQWFSEMDLDNEQKNIYYGYIASISLSKSKSEKDEILDLLYYYKEIDAKDIQLNLYYKVFQYKKDTKSYIIKKINKHTTNLNIFDNKNHINIIKAIPRETVYEKKKYHNTSYLCYSNNVIYHDLLNNDKFKINTQQHMELEKVILNKYENDLKLTLTNVNDGKIYAKTINSKEILYSNFTNTNQTFGHDIIQFLNSGNIFIPDIFRESNTLQTNTIFNYFKNSYIISKNNIIMKHPEYLYIDFIPNNKMLNEFSIFYHLIKINPNYINWSKYIIYIQKHLDTLKTFKYDVIFIKSFDMYYKEEKEEAEKIIQTFIYLSLSELFNFIMTKDEINNFLHNYINSKFLIHNCSLVEKLDNRKEINPIYQTCIIIVSSVLFFIKKYKTN